MKIVPKHTNLHDKHNPFKYSVICQPKCGVQSLYFSQTFSLVWEERFLRKIGSSSCRKCSSNLLLSITTYEQQSNYSVADNTLPQVCFKMMLEVDCNGKVKTSGRQYMGIVVVTSRQLGLPTKQNVFHKKITFHNLAMGVYSSCENHRSESFNTVAIVRTHTFWRDVRRPCNRVCANIRFRTALNSSQCLLLVRNSQFAALHGT